MFEKNTEHSAGTGKPAVAKETFSSFLTAKCISNK